jgi:hypothetical protein
MTIASLPVTSLGAAAAAVVEKLAAPGAIERIECPNDTHWRALRHDDVTASVAAALLGEHEWETAYSLFISKSGALENDVEDSGPVRRGRLLEPVAVQVLREEHPGWIIQHNAAAARVYYRDPEARIGGTPDVEVRDQERGFGVVQIKSVEASVFRRKWCADGAPEPPLWIAVQAIIEAALTGATWAAVAPIVVGHGVEMPLIDIPLTSAPAIMARLRAEVAAFWKRVAENDPPPPDYARDGATIARLYGADDGSTIVLDGWNRGPELAAEDETLASGIKELTERRKAIKAELLEKIGSASVATIDGRVFATAKTVKKKPYAVAASEYRDVRFSKQRA